MGKSIDLPDPLESAGSQPLGNADDLLAQLAGEEVDRLLAEADAEKQQQPAAAETTEPAVEQAAAPAPEPPVQEQLDALFSEITSEQPTAPTAPAPEQPTPTAEAPKTAPPAAVAPVPAILAEEVEAPSAPVSNKLPQDVNPDEVMAAILGEPGELGTLPDFAPPPPVPTALIAAAAAAKTADAETTAAERQGLAVPNPADELPGPGELEALTGPIEDDKPLPAYLKPLEWLNAPLEFLPPTARDVLGQVAVLTLVNAIAVLIYVFVFRRH